MVDPNVIKKCLTRNSLSESHIEEASDDRIIRQRIENARDAADQIKRSLASLSTIVSRGKVTPSFTQVIESVLKKVETDLVKIMERADRVAKKATTFL